MKTANSENNKLCQLLGIIDNMQSNIVSQIAQSEFAKLQLINDKRISDLQKQIENLKAIVTKLSTKHQYP